LPANNLSYQPHSYGTVTGNGEDGAVVVMVEVVVEGMLSSGWNLISWHARIYIKTLLSAEE